MIKCSVLCRLPIPFRDQLILQQSQSHFILNIDRYRAPIQYFKNTSEKSSCHQMMEMPNLHIRLCVIRAICRKIPLRLKISFALQ